MTKERKSKMFLALGTSLVLIGAVMIWFHIPYSPVKQNFESDTATLIATNKTHSEQVLFTKEDFLDLPRVIQKCIENY